VELVITSSTSSWSPAGSIVGALYHKLQTESSAPEDGRNYRPKHVEMIGIINKIIIVASSWLFIQCVPLVTEPDISLLILPLTRILQRNLKRTTDTPLFISHTTNVLLLKFRCNILNIVRIIKEMPGSVASGTPCIIVSVMHSHSNKHRI